MQATHICGGGIGTTAHPKASKKWICESVIYKLKETPLYRAVDIQKDILRDHDVRLPYKRAWMGKEVARSVIHGSVVSSYDLLLWALLFIDRTHLLAKYGGILLGATTKDSNDGLFHVAFAIVDNETDENWTWFLATLGEALYGEDTYDKIITFISNRSKGLVNAITQVFPSSPHGYCLRHLETNFMKTNSSLGKSLRMQCWAIVVKIMYAYTLKEFDDAVRELALPYTILSTSSATALSDSYAVTAG
ncbi:uncharacterized protein LOC120268481 [Dioscorea cayenensis subsp. rotundata]|uniref:Uncharacterized protein LOC120268481 n=1 Tax=Dioscorea cayennensis subsp. rotundata TaxID=55577 RepID=A0AB40BZ79_DIOCR|nr:uncharacterized protein LOC120268481 [Dioscorea cayenensis subsp. rotundata]